MSTHSNNRVMNRIETYITNESRVICVDFRLILFPSPFRLSPINFFGLGDFSISVSVAFIHDITGQISNNRTLQPMDLVAMEEYYIYNHDKSLVSVVVGVVVVWMGTGDERFVDVYSRNRNGQLVMIS